MNILNLGSGNRILTGDEGDTVINHDIVAHRPEVDIVWDLNVTPWCFKNEEFDKIEFISVIEHLRISPIEALDECHRILKPDGLLVIKYPLFSSPTFHDDPTHIHAMSEHSLDYVIEGTRYGTDYSFYSKGKWKLIARGVIKGRNVKAKMTPIK